MGKLLISFASRPCAQASGEGKPAPPDTFALKGNGMEKDQIAPATNEMNPMQPVIDLLQGASPDAVCLKYGISHQELDRRFRDYQTSRSRAALVDQLKFEKIGRNDPCPCGSGKKYKKCCLPVHEEARKSMAPDQYQAMAERAKAQENLQKDVEKGFDLLFSQDFEKAQKHSMRLLESHPEEDRLHDIVFSCAMATGDYDRAFRTARSRWQVAQDEKAHYQEHGAHKREGKGNQFVHFYSPSTWLEKFWMAERARAYRERFPATADLHIQRMVEELKAANDVQRFPSRQEEGYEARRVALAPVLQRLEAEGPSAIPHLLPLTYWFSWASLFVPDLLFHCGTDECIELLAELSMFRFPHFAQKCLTHLEAFGERAIPHMEKLLTTSPVFDELKVGLILALSKIPGRQGFEILLRLTEHENKYVVNWVCEALGRQGNPEALPYLEKAKRRVGELSKLKGAIEDLAKVIR